MLGWLFASRDPVIRLGRGADRRAFLAALGQADLVVLSLPLAEGLDPASMNEEQLLALIEAGVNDLSRRQEFPPFTYPREGRRCLPVFSSLALAQAFIGEYVREVNRVLPFQALTVKGRRLREAFLSAEQVALNARSRHERLLSAEELRLIAEGWA